MQWIVGAGLILLVSLLFNLPLLAYAMYVLLTVLLLSRYLTRVWANSLGASRECHRLTVDVGDKVAVTCHIENRGRWPIPWYLVEDLLPRSALVYEPPSLRVLGRRVQLSMLGPGGKRWLRYQLQCNRRGYYQIGPLVLETGDLFGLHRRYQVATHPDFLLVLPKIVPIQGYDIQSRRPLGEMHLVHRLYEDPTRIAGVRRYEAGDPLNRVHWRATARTGQLHSKVYEPSTVAGATIVLEFHRDAHQRRHEPFRSELGVTAAASLAHALYQMGHQTGLITNGRDAADRIRQEGWESDLRTRATARQAAAMLETSDRLRPIVVSTRQGPDQLMQILENLARVELTDGLTFSQLIAETASRLPRDATVVAILPTVTYEHAVTLGNLRRQGYAVAAILNVYDELDLAPLAGPLLAERIDVFHLRDENSLADICQRMIT